MNKSITMLVMMFILAGCTTQTTDAPPSGTTITSKCDSFCAKMVADTFQIKPFKTIFGHDEPVGYAILSELNGVRGTNTHYDRNGSYNSSWDGGFTLPAKAGSNTIFLYPSAVINAPDHGTSLKFEAIEGHKYFVGTMGWKEIKTPIEIHNWHPVIVDLTDKKIIYPLDTPHWRTYCVIMREFAGGTPCPELGAFRRAGCVLLNEAGRQGQVAIVIIRIDREESTAQAEV